MIRLIVFLMIFAAFLVTGTFTFVQQQVREMTVTFYDDGKACPGNCDSHVVFNDIHNGTTFAFDPDSTRSRPQKCRVGEKCIICFSASNESCMEITYRGSGPPVGKFDLTTTFLKENCERDDLPAILANECRTLKPKVDQLSRRINCFDDPDNPKCRSLIESAKAKQRADTILYDECKRIGETRFNRQYASRRELQRSLGCSYERYGTGRNSRGVTWRKLLPGACRTGTFVGRDGLDCCSNNLYAAAKLGVECNAFFPAR